MTAAAEAHLAIVPTRRASSPDGIALLLRAESLAVFAAAVAAYAYLGGSWALFAALLLAPDLAMLFYLAGPRVGAVAYNLVHAYVAPLALAIAGVAFAAPMALSVALIWLAHIGLDRALGYGLKYPSGFADTHLGRIGRAR
ncbi:MAG: DUF4260 family protein [Bradyrhizobium sp.]|nr:MAG: DUF4260 family protein [Bradyrhizobium sp.]